MKLIAKGSKKSDFNNEDLCYGILQKMFKNFYKNSCLKLLSLLYFQRNLYFSFDMLVFLVLDTKDGKGNVRMTFAVIVNI